MSKHTPGPWIWGARLSGSENHRGFNILQATGTGWSHAHVQPGDEDGKLGEANARLIAAAPELLEALQKMFQCWCGTEENEAQRTALNLASSAIAKATGSAA